MGLFPQQFIDDLKQHADIVVVIQDYVSLKKTGATFKGLCPFHGEKTPSFHVNRDKGFFHCFGCGAGGDVFKFLELRESVSFPDAVRMLAQRFGMTLPDLEQIVFLQPRDDRLVRQARPLGRSSQQRAARPHPRPTTAI